VPNGHAEEGEPNGVAEQENGVTHAPPAAEDGAPAAEDGAGASVGNSPAVEGEQVVSRSSPSLGPCGGSTMCCIATGRDAVGITSGFVAVLSKYPELTIIDMAQVNVNGSLLLSFMVDAGRGSAMNLMKDLLLQAQLLKMKLEFRFPLSQSNDDSVELARPRDGQLIVRVSTEGKVTLKLLHELAAAFQEHNCNIMEVKHEREGATGLRHAVLQYRVAYLDGLEIDPLYALLQKSCWEENAEVFVRRFDDLSKPKRHSLVVLGCSDVVVPYDILDKILEKAGVQCPDSGGVSPWHAVKKKIAALKGVNVSVLDEVADNLQYTPGAKLVCASLKALGFKVALITGSAPTRIANRVKKDLGVDYAIAQQVAVDEDGLMTGEIGGALGQLMDEFRKVDMIHLLADREQINPMDIITVGGYEVPDDTVKMLGPRIYFNAAKHRNLCKVLQLMGFTIPEISELQRLHGRRAGESLSAAPSGSNLPYTESESDSESKEKPGHRFLVRLVGSENTKGQMARILGPVAAVEAEVLTVDHSTMHSMCVMGIEILYDPPAGQDPYWPLKEMMFAAKVEKFEFEFLEDVSLPMQLPLAMSNCTVTMVALPSLPSQLMRSVLQVCVEHQVNIRALERLSGEAYAMAALAVSCSLPSANVDSLKGTLLRYSQEFSADIALQNDDVHRWSRRVIVFDMDSTLIQQEVIDELAAYAGVEEKVKAITEAAMAGEIDFHESLRQRVSLLAGADSKELFAKVKANLQLTPGAEILCSTLKRHGFKMAVISGGFSVFARHVKQLLGLDYAFANELEVDAQGLLTGRTIGPVVTPSRKRNLVSMIAEVEECDLEQVIAVGDGANDIPMLSTAGLGVAFCAKPKVQAAANFRVNHCDLSTLMYLIGLSDAASEQVRQKKQA